MKLKELYKHRTDFTIIGLTGRLGSGCTQIAKILSKDYKNLNRGLRNLNEFESDIFKRKIEIVQNYLSYNDNWQKFDIIDYDKVVIFISINNIGTNFSLYSKFFNDYLGLKEQKDLNTLDDINSIAEKYQSIIKRIKDLGILREIKNEDLNTLNELFYNKEFNFLCGRILKKLDEINISKRMFLIHKLSCNIRKTGEINKLSKNCSSNLYSVAEIINKLIKARRKYNRENNLTTHIVIDCLKNSLEIMFFKERFSAFYMIATKDIIGNSLKRLEHRFKNRNLTPEVLDDLKKLDDFEYKTKDFSKGIFTSPDIENCIQKSDYHIFNLKKTEISDFYATLYKKDSKVDSEIYSFKNSFLTREEQLLKLVALINQPGLITPNASERNMQIAFTAKLNSGCISRQVGAVITDNNYIAKSIGWNDVAKGHTPCNLRNIEDFLNDNLKDNPHYSNFEKGMIDNTSEFKYKKGNVNNFKNAIVDYFEENYDKNKDELNGKNCSFCFKEIHNYYEGEKNQVHTRSLHAEENAMMQLTKFGGMGVKNGYLFTTASPCELCSKKAYQLGIRIIFFIDPYPGIAINQIIDGGDTQPLLVPFSGAIGNSYHRLYEPYLSAKDEISMTLGMNEKNININQFKNILKSIYPDYSDIELDKIKNIKDVRTIIDRGLYQFENEEF